ncbi:terminase small subunit [Orenia metallireducens]|jgi:hypothetical protein|uniref:Terminase small subunit n=1 Tax=Orenia metallireducens TaxID=1413210 RepID=A0A285GBN5_9FIRM|nr:terminase small subunit [Orenia metallireducens]PRX32523.1 terminase small subunit [Orenia metallireducens]SNY20987.1 Terminase small subunit [Orenia metallireducens]
MLKKILYYLAKPFHKKTNQDKNSLKLKLEEEKFPEDMILEEKWDKLKGDKSDPLSERQQRFVIEYLKDYDIKQAAIRAGYSKRTANANGTTLLSLAKINSAIKKERKKLIKK